LIGTGWQIQDQYQGFRGTQSVADRAGKELAQTLSKQQLSEAFVLAQTRFDATNVAIWADSPELGYEMFAAGASVDASFFESGTRYVMVLEGITLTEFSKVISTGDGFTLYLLD
jgi:hypothetical protein